MNVQNLVKMANQIGQFFESEPDQQRAIQDVAKHIKRFWDPGMRREIVAYADQGGAGLLPIVREAIAQNKPMLG